MLKRIGLILILTFSTGYADLDSGVFGSEKMIDIEKGRKRPFSIDVSFDYIGSSKFCDKPFKNERQRFSEGEVELGFVFHYNARCCEAARATIGYTRTHFDWKGNPFFDQTNFNYVSFEVGGVTKRYHRWEWQANFSINADTDHFEFGEYANYDMLLWGRYDWSRCIGFHAGFIAYAGMCVNKVFPIIGFDWQISRKWKLNAVFPVNMSLVYTFNSNWSAALAGRFFYNRYRTGSREPLPKAIFEYSNAGVEFAVNYDYCSWIQLNLHGGSTVGGQVQVSNKNHHHKKRLNIGAAPYAGFEAEVRF